MDMEKKVSVEEQSICFSGISPDLEPDITSTDLDLCSSFVESEDVTVDTEEDNYLEEGCLETEQSVQALLDQEKGIPNFIFYHSVLKSLP